MLGFGEVMLIPVKNLQGIIHIQACGRVYWIFSSIQIPLAVAFTAWMLYHRYGVSSPCMPQDYVVEINPRTFHKLVFPMMTLLARVLGGFFGIGGGMLINPLLLQLGMEPEKWFGNEEEMNSS